LTRPWVPGSARVSVADLTALRARWARPLQLAWLALVVAFVAWKLWEIGWRETLRDLPTSPWFYLIHLANFAVLPLTEQRIYAMIWDRPIALVALLRKRALNNSVLGYSGDLSFYWWARTRLRLPDKQLLAGIKDSSVLSGIAGTLATLALVAAFAATGQAGVFGTVLRGHERGLIVGGVILVLAVPLAWRFRKLIVHVPARLAATVFGIHLARVLLTIVLQALQWWAGLPGVPVETWLLFLTVQAVIGQLPLLPNRELLFLAVSLELVRGVGVEASALSALMVATALVKQLLNLGTLAVTSAVRTEPPADEAEGGVAMLEKAR
jgi:hypothetical protein